MEKRPRGGGGREGSRWAFRTGCAPPCVVRAAAFPRARYEPRELVNARARRNIIRHRAYANSCFVRRRQPREIGPSARPGVSPCTPVLVRFSRPRGPRDDSRDAFFDEPTLPRDCKNLSPLLSLSEPFRTISCFSPSPPFSYS